jgi:tetratricopeptide (TPR) repeat protein
MLWRQGDVDAALTLIENAKLSDGISGFGTYPIDVTTVRRWVLAELLFQAGRYDEARRWYQTFDGLNSFIISGSEFYSTPAHRRLAEIARIQEDTETAIYHLEQFIHAWRNADPELQVDVAEAQAELDDLWGAQAREPDKL